MDPQNALTKAEAREAVLKALEQASMTIPGTRPDDLAATAFKDVPDWHGFEHALWALGESVRQLIVAHPSLRRDNGIFERIIPIATSRAAIRGRQSFVLLFGSVQLVCYAPQIASQLDDWAVEGHVIATLNRMRAPEYSDVVRPFTESNTTWIRREARRYLSRYDGATQP